MKYILFGVEDRIATVTLNRPELMNALHDDMVQELWEAVDQAAKDDEVRVVVLTGSGRAFCAGGDVGGFGEADPHYLINKQRRPFDMNRGPDYQTQHSYFPAIGKPIARLGLTGEYGMTWILARIVGQANALDLLLSAGRVKAPEALPLGLVNRVCPLTDLAAATYAYARDMADNCSPRSLRMLKQQVYDVPFQSLAEAVRSANQDMLLTNLSEDFKEGYKAFLEKRQPHFRER